ncbi:MAG: hypothetical protein WAV04_03280 [Candidatus Microsaccharimonas sp.]
MIDERFVFVAFALALVGTAMYIKGILQGKVKPNIVTWGLWATAPLLAVAAQIDEGAGLRAVHTFSTAFGPMLIIVAALIKRNAFAKIKKSDYIFGALAITGLVLWQITGQGYLAIIFAIAADGFAALPTILKLYREPKTENGVIFGFGILASTITLLTISDWRFEEFGFTLYILIITIIMFLPTGVRFTSKILRKK